ncbi:MULTISPECIES: Gfo/Idh/MocA family protein [Pseudomonas]|uniref:4-carboxy-2-hydroxymuconate-6-semialdehyde dehydrogenase n=1 Tax=Pseudomonas putida TaxID=303 RepID=A0A1B2F939_PSEPU|nr:MULTISPECIES: Gfo/Idh/MocA family oxidoreductase [Pseudomonas]ANY88701.1 4-carboxy-2-hydroxymuconate-6-semialdehyde dehydrogenase [Pseudomonas putida]MCL8305634.1 Gfo/Idh/MocA family oxidoreductase [Pseudomonas putida]
MVRILFCGLGGIGQRHLRNLRSVLGEELEVHAFRVRRQRIKLRDNLTVEEGADLEADYGVIVHDDLDSALACQPDAAYICNPNSLHVPIALACAKANVAVFMEKPLASDLQGIEELMALVAQKQMLFYVGYNFRFHPGLLRIKSLLDEGFFGNIIRVSAEIGEYLPNWHRYEDYRQMYAARADQGGGVILSQIHEMDLIYWFFGLPRNILTVGGQLSNLEIDVEDTATSLMHYSGDRGSFPIHLHQDFIQRPPVRTFKIIGDAGVAELDLINTRLAVYNAVGEQVESNSFEGFVRNDMFLDQAKHFLECLRGQAQPQVTLFDGLQSLRLSLAARESLHRGARVELEEIVTYG